MKKLLFITVLITGIVIGCKKENETKAIVQQESFDGGIPKPGPTKEIPPNFCKGCGNSQNSERTCVYLDSDLGYICSQQVTPNYCLSNSINVFNENNGIQDSLSLDTAYQVRDSFLILSNIGQKYITYYYIIGQVIYENNALTLSNINTHLTFAHNVYSLMEVINYGSNSDVPVTTSFKNDALNMISYYRNIETDQYFQDILDDIENDLDNFEGKTNSQIFDLLYP